MEEKLSSQQREFKRLMDEAGWTAAETARRIQVSRSAITQILNGKNNPKTALERLRSAVGGSPNGLPPNEGEPGRVKSINTKLQDDGIPTTQWCKDYFDEFLRRAGGKADHLGYVKTVLRKHFPLTLWDDIQG